MRQFNFAVAVVLAGVVGLGSTGVASAVVIDDFSAAGNPPTVTGAPPWVLTSGPGGWTMTLPNNTGGTLTDNATSLGTGLSGVIGGSRSVATSSVSVPNGGSVDFGVAISGPNQGFISNRGDGSFYNVTLQYDGNGSGLNHDFSNDSTFDVTVRSFDFAFGNTLEVEVTLSDGSNVHTEILELNAMVNSPTVFSLALGNFSAAGVDLSNVFSVAVSFNADNSHDFIIQSFSTTEVPIPEPASLALWGMLGVGLFAYRRRQGLKGRQVTTAV